MRADFHGYVRQVPERRLGVPSDVDYDLDEFTFRFNRRTARSRGLLFTGSCNKLSPPTLTPYRELPTAASPDHHLWA